MLRIHVLLDQIRQLSREDITKLADSLEPAKGPEFSGTLREVAVALIGTLRIAAEMNHSPEAIEREIANIVSELALPDVEEENA